jgi:hypothetical protein
MSGIRYIPHDQIDLQKWDLCIDNSSNGLIYTYSWYLNACGVKWDGLILNDYEAVMPLTWKKKYGICYLFQPWFCANLGIFSSKNLTEKDINDFLATIPKKFKYIDISLNYGNKADKKYIASERVSYLLSLQPSYEELQQSYRTQLKRNLAKATSSGLNIKWGIDIHSIFPLAKEIMQRVSPINDEEVQRMIHLTNEVHTHQQTVTIGAYSPNNQLLASAVFYHSHNRWYYLIVGNHPNGKTLGASHYLIDCFIRRYANTNSVLDFEGSDIRNIAYFYSSFGATPITYQAIKINRLPKIIRWVKK